MTGALIGVAGLHMNAGAGGGSGGGGGGGGGSGGPPGQGGTLSVIVAPDPCRGEAGNAPPASPDTGLIEHAYAIVTGGTAPLSYLWSWVSGTPHNLWGMTDPTEREVWWSFQTPDHREAVYQVRVTDGLGAVKTATVTIIAN
jgi:hypothetical protein